MRCQYALLTREIAGLPDRRVLSLQVKATLSENKMRSESDKSVYFSMPFITAVKPHHALCMRLKLICCICLSSTDILLPCKPSLSQFLVI